LAVAVLAAEVAVAVFAGGAESEVAVAVVLAGRNPKGFLRGSESDLAVAVLAGGAESEVAVAVLAAGVAVAVFSTGDVTSTCWVFST